MNSDTDKTINRHNAVLLHVFVFAVKITFGHSKVLFGNCFIKNDNFLINLPASEFDNLTDDMLITVEEEKMQQENQCKTIH